MADEPYWKDWAECWVAPRYGAPADATGGMPRIVLANSPEHALEQARMCWPTADGWELLGLVDPKDRECVLPGHKALATVLVRKQSPPIKEPSGRHQVDVAMLEFDEGGNTIWVHSPRGATVLRIKTLGGKIVVNNECSNTVSHSDIIVEGDIEMCMPPEEP